MANRIKEDERNERIIRNLLKLSDNRRCINCNSLGPQYVCTNFSTFVCTTCSGIHREFTHRVKSVSMAKFTSQEVSALQGGGNASAKEIYLKDWDPQRHSVPDSSNVEKLRDFIKHVYVDRRYTGERSSDKPPRVKMGETEDFSENRKPDPYQGGSRSPPYEDTYEQRRHSDRPSPGGRSDDRNYRNNYDERRSPGSDSDFRSPPRTEIVNDWRRDDRFGNGRRSEDNNRISEGGSKLEGRSPDRQKDLDISSPPIIRPVRDILGDNVSPLRIIEPPKGDDRRSADTSARTQRTASSSSLASSNGNPAELRTETSLIDFDDIPEPPLSAAVPQTQQTATSTSSNDNWANFDSVTEVKVSKAPSNANLLESVLSELSVTAPVDNMSPLSYNNPLVTPTGNISVSPFGSGAPAVSSASNSMAFPHSGAPSGQTFDAFGNVADRGQWHAVHPQQRTVHPQQPFLFPMVHSQPPAQPFTPAVGGASSNQPWNSLLTPNLQGLSSAPASHPPQVVSRPALQVTSGLVAQPTHVELRPTAKKELPEDLFATNYSSHPVPIPGWQNGPPHGIGFNMQYNMAASVPTFPQSSKSTNPFDFNNDPSPVQAPTFPSMASLQGALPSMGSPSQTWMPPPSSHPLAMPPPPQASYAPAMPPGSYMGQQVPPNMSLRPLGFGIEQGAYGSFNPNQQQSGIYSAPANPNTFSSAGGNPFG